MAGGIGAGGAVRGAETLGMGSESDSTEEDEMICTGGEGWRRPRFATATSARGRAGASGEERTILRFLGFGGPIRMAAESSWSLPELSLLGCSRPFPFFNDWRGVTSVHFFFDFAQASHRSLPLTRRHGRLPFRHSSH